MIRTPTDDFEDHYTNPYTKFFFLLQNILNLI